RDKFGRIEGLKVCLVGDVLHSRVARSNVWGLTKLGAQVAVCGPRTLLPRGIEDLGVTVFEHVEEAIQWADALNVLRLQLERMEAGFIPSLREYYRVFGVTAERLEKAPRPLTIMHPGPMNRGVEIATGARAAAAGGFTAVCAMPNTDPVTDNQAAVGFIVRQSVRAGLARVYPIGAVSVGQKGERLSEFGEMVGAGAVAVSDDGKPVVSSHLMRTALEYARTFGVPVADHCEEPTLAAGGVMHEGLVATRLGLKGMPPAAEEIMVGRDILLAGLTGGHVHLCHVSTRGSVELIRRAKEQGIHVTAEATPHHLTLTDRACEGYDTHAKMNPPLREGADVAALRAALAEGVIDCIASDHAPHAYDAKEAAFDDAPFGIVGLETAFGVAHTELVLGGVVSLPELLRRMSTVPAAVFRLPEGGGTLR